MAAPTLTPLPLPPTRANPADFATRADSFLTALPALAVQINALVAYWNNELDASVFLNRNTGGDINGAVTFRSQPTLLAAATAGDQPALTLGKGTTNRQAIRIGNDGSINIVPLNSAAAILKINGAAVYHPNNKPTPVDIGALPAASYTAADVLAKLLTLKGSSGLLNADLLGGQDLAFLRNAGNLNAGTVPDARLPSNIVRSGRALTGGDGINAIGDFSANRTVSVDATVARRNAANTFAGHAFFASGAIYIEGATSHVWMRDANGGNNGLIYCPSDRSVRLRSYQADLTAYSEAQLYPSGTFSANAFSGNGGGLTGLNAAQLSAGTVPDARLPSNLFRTGGGSLSGFLTLHANPTAAMHAATKSYVDSMGASQLSLSGGTLSGMLLLPATMPTNASHAVRKGYVDQQDALQVSKAGDSMSGQLSLALGPTGPNHAAHKGYVDGQVATRLTQAQADARYPVLAGNGLNTFGPNMALRTDAYNISSNTGFGWAINSIAGNGGQIVTQNRSDAAAGGASYLVYYGSSITFRVNNNGNVQNLNNSYGSLSDARLKENIVDAGPQLEDMLALRPVNFNLIGDDIKQIGLIAQEVQQIKPGLVDEDEEGTLSVKYSVLVPLMLKALQELTEEVRQMKEKGPETDG